MSDLQEKTKTQWIIRLPGYLQAGKHGLGGGVTGGGLLAGEQGLEGLARSNGKEGSEILVKMSHSIVFLELYLE